MQIPVALNTIEFPRCLWSLFLKDPPPLNYVPFHFKFAPNLLLPRHPGKPQVEYEETGVVEKAFTGMETLLATN